MMKYIDDYKNPGAARKITENINTLAEKLPAAKRNFSIMEVCGSHTMAIARYGIRELLPENISLISGPGCPVCVTDAGYIDTAVELSRNGITIATFGDMINVPGSDTSLGKCRSEGADIHICYSPLSALELAEKNPDREVVFLAIGFETTIAPLMALLETAKSKNIKNLSIMTAFKLVPPALEALTSDPELKVDSFLCPAHVSAIIGERPYQLFVKKHKIPCVIASFEPLDILYGIEGILEQVVSNKAFVDNRYKRVVKQEGNTTAQHFMDKYLVPYDASWRGIGIIPRSGLKLKNEFDEYNTEKRFNIEVKPGKPNPACRCGDVLKGKIKPSECPLFRRTCNPFHPVGPCMVSSEGSCAAFFKYVK
ncbi:MAG: hydrogenase formation protein HypD [Victivallales bacterium]|nr:hydrogenase formation protein HypD [Victivallales bacterium]